MWVGLLLLISVVEALLDVPEGVSLVITASRSASPPAPSTWYLAHCQRLIAQSCRQRRRRSELTARGGTSVVATLKRHRHLGGVEHRRRHTG